MGIGLACRDRNVVFCSTFAAFFTRAFDQIRLGAISQTEVNFVGNYTQYPVLPILDVTSVTVFSLDMAVLKIGVVKKGHEGVYKCVSQNFANEIKYNSVEVRVLETGMY